MLCFTVFEAILKRFQRVSAGGDVPLEKKTSRCLRVRFIYILIIFSHLTLWSPVV